VKQMPEIKQIVNLYELHGSYKRTARELNISRNTVKKYVHQVDDVRDGKTEEIVQKNRTKSRPCPVLTETIREKIHQYLESGLQNREKQQITAKRIWELLIRNGDTIGYTTVKEEVARWREHHTLRSISILQEPQKGIRAEFDWGAVFLSIKGIERRYSLAVFVLPFSLYRFARLYHRETRNEVIDAHIEFFNEIQAVPETIFYDRMSTAYDSRKQKFHDDFLKFPLYFGYEPCACNAASPQEKGTTEESVGYIRRLAFGEKSEFGSFEEAEEWLKKCLAEVNTHPVYRRPDVPTAGLAKERPDMLPLPTLEYSNYELTQAAISKYSLVKCDSNHYSVPETYCTRRISYKKTVHELIFLDGNAVIATHRRLSGKDQYSMNIMHYIKTFQKKPGALKYSKVMTQVDQQIQDLFNLHYTNNPREFLTILDLVKQTSVESFIDALKRLKECNLHPDYNSIRFFIHQTMEPPEESFEEPVGFAVLEPVLTDYDYLMEA